MEATAEAYSAEMAAACSGEAGGDQQPLTMNALMASQLVAAVNANPRNKMAAPPGNKKIKNLDNLRLAIGNLEKMLRSESSDVQLVATKRFRQLLSVGDRDPMGAVQDMLDQNIVPQLLQFLKKKGHAALQVEALWALTNIAAGTTEHTHLLIKNNAVPTLVSLLDSNHQEVLEQAVWVLGNIAGDGTTARDTVLAAGALDPLLKCMNENKKTSLLRIATWTLSNLCDGQPRPVFKVDAVLTTIRDVLQSEDTEVLSHACWALSHLCDGPSPHIQAVVQANVCGRLVELLHCKSWRVVKPALRTVGNIVCAEDEQDYTQQIIECGAVPCLRMLIKHSNREIQKEACWTLSNIAAGTIDQIQCVLDSGSIPTLVDLASKDAATDPDVKIEACWVLLNATSCGSDAQIEHLVQAGCVSVLCNLLHDNSMVMMALEGLEKILQVGEELAVGTEQPGTNTHASLLDTEKIEALQRHRSSAIAKRAARMWKQYFVTCAICSTPYSRNSPLTKFCSECKCNVCSSCDCSVYHLSYQDALWKDLAEGEAKVAKGKQNAKKQKRKKKKAAKDKKRKQQGNDEDHPDQEGARAAGAKSGDEHDQDEAGVAEAKAGSDQTKASEAASKKSSKDNTNGTNSKAPTAQLEADFARLEVDAQASSAAAPRAPSPTAAAAAAAAASASASAPATAAAESRVGGDWPEGASPASPGGADGQTAKPVTDYVEFLSNNGSILDLWKMINENENSKTEDSPIPLETST